MNEDQPLPPDPQLPSSLSPGDRETLTIVISAIDRHTEALNRIADAMEKQALAHTNLADRAKEWMERNVKGW